VRKILFASYEEKTGTREITHDRDVNASKNILNEEILKCYIVIFAENKQRL
jgi:hypothetical protein